MSRALQERMTVAQYLTLMGVKPLPDHQKAVVQALGRLPTGTMNKTETRYAQHLDLLKHAGEVLWWKFEGIKLRLADNTFLTIDFAVLTAAGMLEMHEVKGFWTDDARAKTKIASVMYPFRFIAVTAKRQKDGGGWRVEEFG